MDVTKMRALADYIEANALGFDMGYSNQCIVGYGLKMDGNIGFYEADANGGAVVNFARRFGLTIGEANRLYSGGYHAVKPHDSGAAGTAAMLRELADKVDPIKTIKIEDRSSEPIALTVAIRKTAEVRELVPA